MTELCGGVEGHANCIDGNGDNPVRRGIRKHLGVAGTRSAQLTIARGRHRKCLNRQVIGPSQSHEQVLSPARTEIFGVGSRRITHKERTMNTLNKPTNTPKAVREQYRAELTLPNQTICTVTGSAIETVQSTVRALLNNRVQFQPHGDYAIFVINQDTGQTLGYISQLEVPEHLAVVHITQARRERMAA